MKIIKTLLLLTTLSFFMTIPLEVKAEAAKDCSHLKKLHKKLLCKSGSDIYDDDTSDISTDKNKEKQGKKISEFFQKGEKFNKKYNTLADLFKKKEQLFLDLSVNLVLYVNNYKYI